MQYTDKVLEHFMNPRNIGEIPDADGVGTIGSEECGDMIQVWIKVSDEHLADIKYKVFGCPAAIACCSMMTELAMGKHLDDVSELTDEQVADALGGLPVHKYHCSNLAASVLHKAIMNYVFKSAVKANTVTITTLVDNNASESIGAEHGLSLWLEYGDKRILFDTGQSDLLMRNAKELSVNLAEADAIVISHGHYDHTGGLSDVLELNPRAVIYIHPAAIKSKYSCKDSKIRSIGMPEAAKQAVKNYKAIWTEKPLQLCNGVTLTGQIPRKNDFEDVGGAFFVDESCYTPDNLLDDQALFIKSPNGLIVVFGCAHSGVVNTLNYVTKLTGQDRIYAVIGGMHLLNASLERIEYTIEAFRQYQVQKIGPCHCTGVKAIEKFKEVFPDRCFICSVGTRINL
ncbi:MAG: iron-sulfur cluster assembly scaffold protein [Phycisphaerae bacterium]|nr:iron-sulfur cluster assembly scaffold protein [Phycisphaerae bacterium]